MKGGPPSRTEPDRAVVQRFGVKNPTSIDLFDTPSRRTIAASRGYPPAYLRESSRKLRRASRESPDCNGSARAVRELLHILTHTGDLGYESGSTPRVHDARLRVRGRSLPRERNPARRRLHRRERDDVRQPRTPAEPHGPRHSSTGGVVGTHPRKGFLVVFLIRFG